MRSAFYSPARSQRATRPLLAAATALLLLVVACGGEPSPVAVQLVAPEPTPRPTTTPAADGSTTPSATATPSSTTSGAVVTSLDDLRRKYGEPPNATYGRVRIPSLGIDAAMGTRVVSADGTMPLPSGPSDAVWYDFRGWDGYGGAPGAGRNAVLSAHVDYAAYVAYAGVEYRGRGIFFYLNLLSPGDRVEVQAGQRTYVYQVQWRREIPEKDNSWSEIMSGAPGEDRITLITCGGQFNFATRNYEARIVVRAVRMS